MRPEISRAQMLGRVGALIGRSDWELIDQDRVNAFAQVSGDYQPIHTDPAFAQAAGFEGTIAHGLLTLSMASGLGSQVLPAVQGQRAVINYGFNKLRFLAPVLVGTMVRGAFTLADAQERGRDGLMLTYDVAVEMKDSDRPAMLANWLLLYQF